MAWGIARAVRINGPHVVAGLAFVGTLVIAHAVVGRAGAVAPGSPVTPVASAPMLAPAMLVPASIVPPQVSEAGAVRFTGIVGEDLSAALDRAGVPPSAARAYVHLLANRNAFGGGLTIDDRFDLVIAEDSGELLYAGLDRVGRSDAMLMKWTDGKRSEWLDADGEGREQAGLKLPIAGRITSPFGNRMHPILGSYRFHKGVDVAAPYGAPIAAALDGRVVSAGWHGGYGQQVVLAHANGTETRYGHMSRIAAYPGETVRRGQLIGYVGSTGLSTGPHLHFEVLRGGRAVNPLTVHLETQTALQGDKLQRFHDWLRQLLVLPGKRA